MDNFEDWKRSSITLMGDPGKKRSTVMKAAVIGLVGLMAAKAVVMPFESSLSSSYQQVEGGIVHSQLVSRMENASMRINAEYGTSNTVIIFKDDANLKFVLANAHADFFKEDVSANTLNGKIRSHVAGFVESTFGVNINKAALNRGGLIDYLANEDDEPSTYMLGEAKETPYDSLMIVKGWGGKDMSKYDNKFPIHLDLNFQNAFGFTHELTHAVDTRDGRIDNPRADASDKALYTEAVADLGTALVFYSRTGNLDDWNYNIKPIRMAHVQDQIHATASLVDKALQTTDLEEIQWMTDRDIMIFAKEKMNETANNMMKNDLSESGVKEWFAMRYMDKAYIGKEKVGEDTYAMSLDRLDRASGTNQGFEMVRDHSRVVMEASMNNLIYNGKFMEKQDDFLVHVAKHIKEYKDEKVANALHAATSSGIFNQAAFAKEMGFKIDYAAANRKDENSEILTQFFMDKSGKDAFAGYDLETIAQNKNPSVISRYANDSKELTQGRNSYIPHIR